MKKKDRARIDQLERDVARLTRAILQNYTEMVKEFHNVYDRLGK